MASRQRASAGVAVSDRRGGHPGGARRSADLHDFSDSFRLAKQMVTNRIQTENRFFFFPLGLKWERRSLELI